MPSTLTRKELNAQDKAVEATMRDKGLCYMAARGYEAHQVYSATTTGGTYHSVVIARIRTESSHDYFAWGYYPRDEAEAVARTVKRTRKFWVMDVTIVDTARRV